MAAIDDAKTVIETLTGRVHTAQELQNIADAFISAKRYGIRIPAVGGSEPNFADPDNPTNEEKAQLFLNAMKWFGQQVVQLNAEKITRAANDANVATAKANALADFS